MTNQGPGSARAGERPIESGVHGCPAALAGADSKAPSLASLTVRCKSPRRAVVQTQPQSAHHFFPRDGGEPFVADLL